MSISFGNKDGLHQKLRCSGCQKWLSSSPIYSSDNGANHCFNCYSPKLGKAFLRATNLEVIFQHFLFPCPNQELGCNDHIKFDKEEEHEVVCNYKLASCSLCLWSGVLQLFNNHINNNHSSMLRNPVLIDLLSISAGTTSVYYSTVNDDSFTILIKSPPNHFGFYILVMCNKSKPANESYRYQLQVFGPNQYNPITFPKRDVEPFFDLTKIDNLDGMLIIDLVLLGSAFNDPKLLTAKIKICHNGDGQHSGSKKSNVRCPECLKLMKSQILLCAGGHSFCKTCAANMKNCLLCQKVMTVARNYALEEFLVTNK